MATLTGGTRLTKIARRERAWGDAIDENFDRLSELCVNVKSFPGVEGDGVNDDTDGMQMAIDDSPAGASLLFPGAGPYLHGQVNIDKRIIVQGQGKNLTTLKAKTGAVGPLINWNNSTLRPGCSLRGFAIDMTNAPAIEAVYMHNVRNAVNDDLYISPGGTIAYHLDLAQGTVTSNVDVFNASVQAFLGSHASSSGNTLINCFSDNTTVSALYSYLFTGGLDWWCIACKAFRGPGLAVDLNYGFGWVYTVPNLNATGKLLGCSTDAISDRTSDSANVAGAYFKDVGNCDIINSFLGAYSLADLTSSAAVKLDNTKNMRFTSNRLGGRGVHFVGTQSRTASFIGNQFLFAGGGGVAMYVLTTAPTNIVEMGSYLDEGSDVVPIASNMANWETATNKNNRRTVLTKAGAVTDGDFAFTPADGTLGLDETNHRLYIRDGGVWKYAALT